MQFIQGFNRFVYMIPYTSKSGKPSGVIAYDYDTTSITVQFTNGEIYIYTYSSCGVNHVNEMKILAKNQLGLSTYIVKNQPTYRSKA